MSRVEQAFKIAGEIYAEYGVNVEKALETLDRRRPQTQTSRP